MTTANITLFFVYQLIIGLIMYLLGKSKGYDSGWKSGMETAERLGAFNQDALGVQDERKN